MKANNGSEIVFDAKSGISEEEQREILAKIDSIAEKNRLSIGEDREGKSKKTRFKAKKSGGVFPFVFNIAAVAVLATGLLVLSSTQIKTDSAVRTGGKVYNSVERALIDEIRKETLALLEANEREISLIVSRLGEIDSEEYLSALTVLRNERSGILEDARAKEAVLQARFENRTRDSYAGAPALQDAAAEGELAALNTEHGLTSGIEAQMGGFFANLNRQIADDSLDEAALTIQAMRDFINTPAFKSLRSVQARKEMYIQSINTFEAIVKEAVENKAVSNSDPQYVNRMSDLQTKIAALEKDIAEKDKTIEAVSSQGSGATRRINELSKENNALQTENKRLERTNNTLQTRNSQLTADLERQTGMATALQRSVNTLQSSVNTLRQAEADLKTEKAETARLTLAVNERDNIVKARDNTITRQEAVITNRNDVIKTIRNVIEGGKNINDMSFNEIRDSLDKIQSALQSLN